MVHGEDLDRLNGGSESSVHFVWGRRTQQDRPEQGSANNAIPMQPSYILFAAQQGVSAKSYQNQINIHLIRWQINTTDTDAKVVYNYIDTKLLEGRRKKISSG